MSFASRTLPALLTLTALCAATSAQAVTVTTSADVVDIDSAATSADLPGPDGVVSFREALLVTDNEPGRQTIDFEVPQDDWYLPSIFPDFCVIQGSFHWNASDSVIIDGSTQTAFTGDTNPEGNEVVLSGRSLYLDGDDTVVTGLHASRVELDGSHTEIRGNTGSMDIRFWFGRGSLVHDNEANTVTITQSNDNVVVRNTLRRVRIIGSGGYASNNRIGGPNPADRNFITGWGNYGEHGSPAGTTIDLLSTRDTLIENNYIGTTPDGMDIGNRASTVGILVNSDNYDVTVRNNLIAIAATRAASQVVSSGWAMFIQGDGSGVHVFGNTMGLNAAGEPLLGGLNGIQVGPFNYDGISDITIGGSGPGEGNVIAGHQSSGVIVAPYVESPNVRISGNSIHANGEIGIDLAPDNSTYGHTPNDPFDADVGGNGLQNFPDISRATLRDAGLHVAGKLHSEPFSDYTIEFYASPEEDPSGFGQGEVFLGSTTIVTDADGNGAFLAALPALVPAGWFVTSTATHEPIGATSEFSACVPIREVPTHVGRFLGRRRMR